MNPAAFFCGHLKMYYKYMFNGDSDRATKEQ